MAVCILGLLVLVMPVILSFCKSPSLLVGKIGTWVELGGGASLTTIPCVALRVAFKNKCFNFIGSVKLRYLLLFSWTVQCLVVVDWHNYISLLFWCHVLKYFILRLKALFFVNINKWLKLGINRPECLSKFWCPHYFVTSLSDLIIDLGWLRVGFNV